MQELMKKKGSKFLLVGVVILVLLLLLLVAYYIRKDLSNDDTSAAVNDSAGIVLDDGSTNNKICDFSGSFAYCIPKYAFAGEKAEVFVNYWSSEPGNAPDWEITICNKVRRTAESSKEYFFRFSNKPCIITIKLFPGTDNEETFSKEYTPMKNIKSFKMAVPTYAPRVGLDYDGSLISGDLSTELLARGVTLEMIQDVVWDYKYNGDVCSGYVDSNYSNKNKYSGYMHPESVGSCRIKLTANVITCANCETDPIVVYQSSKTLNIEVVRVGVLPSPTSYWTNPTPTPTPTSLVSPTPTVHMLTSLVPTLTLTPSVNPTNAAIRLVPNTSSVTQNSEKSVDIIANLTNGNVDGLQIRLNVTGATIVPGSYVTNSSNTIALGTCNTSGASTTVNEICVDIVKINGGTIATNENIGSFKIQASTTNPIIISTTQGNAYLVGDNLFYNQIQALAEYHVTP